MFSHHAALSLLLRVIFSENRFPLFGITRASRLRVIFSENRFPLFGITR
jgi:hypothetical protein